MTHYATSWLGVVAVLLLEGSSIASPSIEVIPKNSIDHSEVSGLLLETDRHYVTATSSATKSEFVDTFFVNIRGSGLNRQSLATFGTVSEFIDNDFAIISLRSPASQELLSSALHHGGMACGTLFRLYGDTVGTDEPIAPEAIHPVDTTLAEVTNLVQDVHADNIRATVEELSGIFTRHHASETGRNVAQTMGAKYQERGNGRSDIAVTSFSHGSSTAQPSMIIRIPGTTRPDEIIILGSHIDSISTWGGRSPGADDNASGTATNLEVYRAIMNAGWRFERTVEIHGYAAEEIGLVGSQDIARKYKQAGKNVVAMLQIDMDLYRDGSEDKIWFVSNSTQSQLNAGLEQLVDRYVHVARGSASLSGGSSDHASWTRQGYAAAFPFENPQHYNRNIHSENDTIANSGAFSQAQAFGKLGLAYLAHYAGLVR